MHLIQAAHTKSHVFIGPCSQIIFHFITLTVNNGTPLEVFCSTRKVKCHMFLASLLTTEGKTLHDFLLFQRHLMQRRLVYKKHSSHTQFVQRMAEHTNTVTNICSYGEKSLDEDSEKGSFSKLAVQQMGHMPLFLYSPTHFTKTKRYVWEPGCSCCLLFLLLYLNAVPHYEAPIQLLGMVL